jgi:hypothetical protein
MSNTGLSWITEGLESPGKGLVVLPLRFRFNAALAPTDFTGAAHLIESVAHTAAGIWTVTLKPAFRGWRGLVAAAVSLELDAAAVLAVASLGPMLATPGTIVVRSFTEAAGTLAAADLPAGANNGNWCHVLLVLKFSTAVDGSGI